MKLLLFFFRTSKPGAIISILTGIAAGASSAGLIGMINKALNESAASRQSLLWRFAGLASIALSAKLVSQLLSVYASQQGMFNLRMQLARQIIAAPLRRIETSTVPRLLATLTEDVTAIGFGLGNIPSICTNGAVLIGCLAYLGWLSGPLLFTLFGFIIVGVASCQMLRARAWRALSNSRQDGDALFKHLRALTEGVKELQLHQERQHAFFTTVLEKTAASSKRSSFIAYGLFAVAITWSGCLLYGLIGTLLFGVPSTIPIDSRTVTGYTLLLLFMMAPLSALLTAFQGTDRALVALERIQMLGLSLAEGTYSVEAGVLREPAVWTQLDFVGVTHTYHKEEAGSFTLGPLNLSFVPGELVFIIGGNGSGKTTFAKLLTGLYWPETGSIVLNGESVTEQQLEKYRTHFTAVFSDFHLFESLLGLDFMTEESNVRRYLQRLHLDRKVTIKNGNFSTTALSAGQRKRLALLTAYVENRPIYVFDEWAADQDPAFKEFFYLELLPELKANGKTVFVISHDDRYYHIADRVIKIDSGSAVVDQNRNQTMSQSGIGRGR